MAPHTVGFNGLRVPLVPQLVLFVILLVSPVEVIYCKVIHVAIFVEHPIFALGFVEYEAFSHQSVYLTQLPFSFVLE